MLAPSSESKITGNLMRKSKFDFENVLLSENTDFSILFKLEEIPLKIYDTYMYVLEMLSMYNVSYVTIRDKTSICSARSYAHKH